nr:MAG: MC052R [Molluscum contagiosum virus]
MLEYGSHIKKGNLSGELHELCACRLPMARPSTRSLPRRSTFLAHARRRLGDTSDFASR